MSASAKYSGLPRPLLTVAFLGALLVALQLPIAMIRGLIGERTETRDQAIADVTQTWGGPQTLVGPRLIVPFRRSAAATPETIEEGLATFLPANLHVDGTMAAEPLRRGLFDVPAYRTSMHLEGSFDGLDPRGLGLARSDLLWEEARLVMEISDPRGVGSASALSWGGVSATLLPGSGSPDPSRRGVHAPVVLTDGQPTRFTLDLELKGSGGLHFTPLGQATVVTLAADWGDPSFVGAWLPDARSVDDDGFTATWRVPFLGRDFPQQWIAADEVHDKVLASSFGVALLSPVDHYRMSERSTKYAPLFLVFTFALLWLFDMTMGVRVHPIQYLLVGCAMCLFYLLELSLSEHIGFGAAYGVAAAGIVGLVATYAAAVLRSSARGAMVGSAMGLLYAYLLALLTLEQYALLAGSVGLFLILAVVMHQTRWIDWSRLGEEGAPV